MIPKDNSFQQEFLFSIRFYEDIPLLSFSIMVTDFTLIH